jgi:hypothetical protein
MIRVIIDFFYPPRIKVDFKPDIPSMADCKVCENHIRGRAINRLTTHLISGHGMREEDAYETVDWVAHQLHEHIKSLRKK